MFDDELDKVFCFRRPVWAAERVERCDLKTDTYTASGESAWICSLKGCLGMGEVGRCWELWCFPVGEVVGVCLSSEDGEVGVVGDRFRFLSRRKEEEEEMEKSEVGLQRNSRPDRHHVKWVTPYHIFHLYIGQTWQC